MQKLNTAFKLSAVIITGLLTGCATTPQELSDFEPIVRPVAPPAPTYENGSLYHMSSSIYHMRSTSLFEDVKPYRIGDIITVRLNEKTSATKEAATNSIKEDSYTPGSPLFMGTVPTFKGNPLLNMATEADREFKGEADSTQSNSLTGQITVTVVDVLPNGNLVVQGEKWFTLNQGKEYIRIAGVVRPYDVAPDNTILSTQLADAQIAYSGEGFLADSNNQGWFGQLLNSKWWPF